MTLWRLQCTPHVYLVNAPDLGAATALLPPGERVVRGEQVARDVADHVYLLEGRERPVQPDRDDHGEVVRRVGAYYQVPVRDLVNGSRYRDVVAARGVAAYLLREALALPLKRCGQNLGGRHHSTVIAAVRDVQARLRDDSRLQDDVRNLWRELHVDGIARRDWEE